MRAADQYIASEPELEPELSREARRADTRAQTVTFVETDQTSPYSFTLRRGTN